MDKTVKWKKQQEVCKKNASLGLEKLCRSILTHERKYVTRVKRKKPFFLPVK